MRTETKIKLTKLLSDIEYTCTSQPATVSQLIELAAQHKTTRAIPTFLTNIGVLRKDGSIRTWVNPDQLTTEKIIGKIKRCQLDSNARCMRKRRALAKFNELETTRKIDQPENFKKNEPIKIDFPAPKQILSTSQFLDQLPIETILNHVQSKGYIVLKP